MIDYEEIEPGYFSDLLLLKGVLGLTTEQCEILERKVTTMILCALLDSAYREEVEEFSSFMAREEQEDVK